MRFAKSSEPTEAKRASSSGQNNILFVKADDSVEEDDTVAVYKSAASGEILTKQHRMQNDIDAYGKTQAKPKVTVKNEPGFPIVA